MGNSEWPRPYEEEGLANSYPVALIDGHGVRASLARPSDCTVAFVASVNWFGVDYVAVVVPSFLAAAVVGTDADDVVASAGGLDWAGIEGLLEVLLYAFDYLRSAVVVVQLGCLHFYGMALWELWIDSSPVAAAVDSHSAFYSPVGL